MNDESEMERIIREYRVFEEEVWKHGYTLDQAKHEVGEGWWPLLEEVFERKPADVNITQVKEKLAGLRIYFHPHNEEFYDYLIEVEHRSFEICEICGEPGKVRYDRPWYKTLCDTHAKGV